MTPRTPADGGQRPCVALVTTDEQMLPVAGEHLAPYFDTRVSAAWDEVVEAVDAHALDALVLDLDTISDAPAIVADAVRHLRSLHPDMAMVGLTRSGARTLRLKASQAGLDEYFVAPIDFQELQVVLVRAIEKRAVEVESRRLQEELAAKQSFFDLIGGSEAMQRVYAAIQRVAVSNTTVLIRGESGTGKELVARALVASSPRADKPFISINCSALPDTLIETELFGHEKGAFTDAREARAGHIELAHTGTLFLDEIATLGLPLQSKLLRVLEDRTVTRIGGKNAKKIDFRLIAATNEDLEEMVQAGRFREDLYYRINVVPILLPALRERTGDIPVLVDHFLRVYCTANRLELKRMDPEVLEVLEQGEWPGNVRELENLIQRLVLMVDGTTIKLRHLPQRILYKAKTTQDALLIPDQGVRFDEEIARIEVAYLQAALHRSQGSKAAAARLLHIPSQKMKYLCRKYKIGND